MILHRKLAIALSWQSARLSSQHNRSEAGIEADPVRPALARRETGNCSTDRRSCGGDTIQAIAPTVQCRNAGDKVVDLAD